MTPTNETNPTGHHHFMPDGTEITYTDYYPPHPATPPAPEDTADYGPMGNPDTARGPDETYCRNCDQLALDHTPGRWSVYGVCPTNETETNKSTQEHKLAKEATR